MTATPDYYELLQVTPTADAEVIQAAYRRLARKWHPDRNPGDPFAFERMKLLNEAYEALSDPAKRREYDARKGHSANARLKEQTARAAAEAESPAAPTPPPRPASPAGAVARWKGVPDAPVIFVAAGVLFLIGHIGILFGDSPAGPVAFLVTSFVWVVLFATPAYFCHLNKLRAGLTGVATLALIAAGLDVAVPIYMRYEVTTIRRETPPQPRLPEPKPGSGESAALEQLQLSTWRMELPRVLPAWLSAGRPWEEVSGELRKRRLDPEPFRQPYQLDLAQRREETRSETLLEYLVRRAVPVASAMGDCRRVGRYADAVQRFNSKSESKEDIEVIVRFERQQGLDQEKKGAGGQPWWALDTR